MYVLKITYLAIHFSAKQQHMWWVPEVCDDGKGFVDKLCFEAGVKYWIWQSSRLPPVQKQSSLMIHSIKVVWSTISLLQRNRFVEKKGFEHEVKDIWGSNWCWAWWWWIDNTTVEQTGEWRWQYWWGWRNESGSWFQKRCDAYLTERFVIFSEETVGSYDTIVCI